jgi:hypothetical protein
MPESSGAAIALIGHRNIRAGIARLTCASPISDDGSAIRRELARSHALLGQLDGRAGSQTEVPLS